MRNQLRDITMQLLKVSQADGITAYYGGVGESATATAVPTVDQLQATPMWSGVGEVIDRIGFNVTVVGGAGSKCRCGLYRGDLQSMKPGSLVVDSGEFDTTIVGFKEAIINVKLDPEQLYFFAFLCGTAAPTCTTYGSGHHPLGRNTNLNGQLGWVKTAFPYGPLPELYPAGPNILTSAAVMVVRRLAAFNRPTTVAGAAFET